MIRTALILAFFAWGAAWAAPEHSPWPGGIIVHEVAHHFGIDDDKLHEWGWG